MLTLYLPLDFVPGDIPMDRIEYHKDKNETASSAYRGKAVLYDKDTPLSLFSLLSKKGGLGVVMNNPQVLRKNGGTTILFKWFFGSHGKAVSWSGQIKVHIASFPDNDISSLKMQKISKSIINLSSDTLEADTALVEYAIATLVSKPALMAANVDFHRFATNQASNIEKHLREAIQIEYAKHVQKTKAKKLQDKKLVDLYSSLPDGTPLVVRSGRDYTWQLGLKNGRVDISTARNSMIAPSEILRGDEMRATGLSSHEILPLDMAAMKARAAHPDACHFQSGEKHLTPIHNLNKSQPFHQSFLTVARQIEPVAWMQTDRISDYRISQFKIHDEENAPILWRKDQFGPCKFKPPLPQTDSRVVALQEVKRRKEGEMKIPNFGYIANLWVLSEAAKDTMEAHELGDVAFFPVEIYDVAGLLVDGKWFYLSVGKPLCALPPHMADTKSSFKHSQSTIQPFQVSVDLDKTGDLDFWWDDDSCDGSMFFSDRLYKALKRIKSMPRIAAKPCRSA